MSIMDLLHRVRLEERPEYRNLLSHSLDKGRPIYNWYPFKHGYSKELVTKLLHEFAISNGRILDPYCGCGTTLLACQDEDVSSIGYDILPFAVFTTNVKLQWYSYDVKLLREEIESFEMHSESYEVDSLPDVDIMRKAFSPRVLRILFGIRRRIQQISPQNNRDLFMLGLLGILEQVSRTSKSGGFLRLTDNKVDPKKVFPTFKNKIMTMIHDLETTRDCQEPFHKSASFIGDSRKLPTRNRFDAVITSPPYPNRHDYTRIYALEMLMNFVESNKQFKQIRYSTIRSHVEAKPKFAIDGIYREPKELTRLISMISKRELNNKAVIPMLHGYFEDMFLSLREVSRCLRSEGHAAFVVSNVRFGGLNIPVDTLLAEIGEQTGLLTQHVWIARYRGNSPQQMGQYGREPSRESIVIWRKQ